MTTEDQIRAQIQDNPVILYMKGTVDNPECGFSANAVAYLQACQVSFETIDILKHPDIRKTLPKMFNWPTFPQLYVQGELIGGADIIKSLYETKELQKILESIN